MVLDEALPEDRRLLRQRIFAVVLAYIRDLPEDLRVVLRTIHHNILLNQILNLDPAMIAQEKRWFSKRRLYLDTNVILSYLFEGHPSHAATVELLRVSSSLGVQLLVSPYTINELDYQVKLAKRDHNACKKGNVVSKLALYSDNLILATFLEYRSANPLAWDAFISPFESWADMLLQYDILEEKEGTAELEGTELKKLAHKYVSEVKHLFASDEVIEHDANNCALILALREKYNGDEMGQAVWLLTIDTSLRRVQKLLMRGKVTGSPLLHAERRLG